MLHTSGPYGDDRAQDPLIQPTMERYITYFSQSDKEVKGILKLLGCADWWQEPAFSEQKLHLDPATYVATRARLNDAIPQVKAVDIVFRLRLHCVPCQIQDGTPLTTNKRLVS